MYDPDVEYRHHRDELARALKHARWSGWWMQALHALHTAARYLVLAPHESAQLHTMILNRIRR